MTAAGSCHCGAVAFEADGEISAVVACNCSICQRKGALLWATTRDNFRLLAGEDQLAEYRFGKGAIVHRFCRTCGIHPFAHDAADDAGGNVYINVRCVADIDLAAIPVIDFDGRSV
jgi:hypothetical protein